jgi:hypothetical protein
VGGLLRGAGRRVGRPDQADLRRPVLQLFVVLSFNVDHIVGDEVWLGRAGAPPIAWALRLTGVAMAISLVRIVVATAGEAATWDLRELTGRVGLSLAASVFAAAGAFGLAAGWTGGLFLLVAGSLASLATGLVIAWVLLVEVLRQTARPEGDARAGAE